MKPTLPKHKSWSPQTREASTVSLLGSNNQVRITRKDVTHQLKEGSNKEEESDPSIVVRDGRTDYMAKGRAGLQSDQSTHARERKVPLRSVSSTLIALRTKAIKEKKHRFRHLYSSINLEMLYKSFHQLQAQAAAGVDGISYDDYAEELDANLRKLLVRLKLKRYRAPHVRRVYIPKAGGKERPLGIPTIEDKIVQQSASMLLESIFEADFSDQSKGYRRTQEGARKTSLLLRDELQENRYRYVVEADIKSFFDKMDHDWLCKMLEQRIDDQAFIGLIRKWLKAGVLDPRTDKLEASTQGTPQGGVISPILANIYLHFVLDLWIESMQHKEFKGKVYFLRYADDIIVVFENRNDAYHYQSQLPVRLAKFQLRLSEEKSGLVKFNRWEATSSGVFTFLGFDYYIGRATRNRNCAVVKRRTNKKKFRDSLRRHKEWIKKARSWPLKMILSSLRKKLRGYWNYYGVQSNTKMNSRYFRAVTRLTFKWLNERSQRKSYTWKKFLSHWYQDWDIPNPRVVEGFSDFRKKREQSEFHLAGESVK